MKTKRSLLKKLFRPEVSNLTPGDFGDEFVDILVDEIWNLDEWTPEGVMMMKHFIFTTLTKDIPGNYDFDQEYLKKLILQKWEK